MAPWPQPGSGPCTEQGVGVCGLGVSSPLGLFQDPEKVPETSELRLSGTFFFRENCRIASHQIVTLCGRQGWSCYSILQMGNLRFTRFSALARATQKCRFLSSAPQRGVWSLWLCWGDRGFQRLGLRLGLWKGLVTGWTARCVPAGDHCQPEGTQ